MAKQLTFWDIEATESLHLYTNYHDYVIAESLEEAIQFLLDEMYDEDDIGEIDILPSHSYFRMHDIDTNKDVVKSVKEWCDSCGKGIFASTEW